jgi:dTDP-4-dehydrorhamnose 3,5-epimerase
MQVTALEIPDIKIVNLHRFEDRRGFFSETYNRDALHLHGIHADFIQDNLSFSIMPGTLRGLHFQRPPKAQAKLIMVLAGRVLDVVVDCRKGSPTFGKHTSAVLSASAWNQLFGPRGFAHGFCKLEPDTTVSYKVDAPYTPDLDSGVIWNDPDLGIQWPVNIESAILSDKDRQLPRFRDIGDVFDVG